MQRVIVMKFGGTSVGNADAIAQTAAILADAGAPVVGVVSAMSGVTNLLLETAQAAAAGTRDGGEELRQALLGRHLATLARLVKDPTRQRQVAAAIDSQVERCGRLVDSVYVLRDLSTRVQDSIVAFGERLSSLLVTAALEERGVRGAAVDAERVIVTDGAFGNATPRMPETRQRTRANLSPLLRQGITPVVTGFFGADEAGATTTLGRGGSDYSATILGAALGAGEVWIWTDVDGVMTADPRLVPEARTLPAISFDEATELAYFGAKVIHPRTMQPAAENGIPVWIKNTFNASAPGTRIGPEAANHGSVKAITAIPNVSVVTVEGGGFLGVASVTARVFSAIGRAEINVFMISQASSQHSLSFAVPGASGAEAVRLLEAEFELDLLRGRLLRIWEDPRLAAVAVVGAGMRGTPGVAGRVFQTLGGQGINVVTIAQGSSELNISCVIAADDVVRAVPALHDAFGLAEG